MSELPSNWVMCKLPQILASSGLISDGDWIESKDQDPEGEIRLIQLADIGDGIFKNKSNRYMNNVKAELLKCTFLQEGDVLIARMPDPLGRACIFPEIDNKSVTVVDVCLIRSGHRSAMLNKLLMFWINSPEIRSMIDMQASGTTRRRITRKKLAELEFPLPPLNEQIRIANKLDSLLAKVDAVQTRLEKIPTLLKRFRQSVLASATSGELTREWRENSEIEWSTEVLKNICDSVSDGDHQAPPKANSGIPFLVISNVNKGGLDLEKATRWVPVDYYKNLKDIRKPQKKNILYTVTGSFGIPVIVNTDQDFCFQRHIAIIKPNHSQVYYRYLFIALAGPETFRYASEVATGTAQKTVSLTNLRSFPIPLPDLDEQKEIVRRVESLFSLADSVEKQYTEAKKRTDLLTQSLLAKAFRGELVPQDPNDEPASELLKHIQHEREQQAANKPKRKTATKRKNKQQVLVKQSG